MFDLVGKRIKAAVDTAGGPIGALLNPHTMVEIGANVRLAFAQLPPSSVVLGAFSRIVNTAIVQELKSRRPSDRFMETCRASGKFESDDAIVAYRDMLLDEVN